MDDGSNRGHSATPESRDKVSLGIDAAAQKIAGNPGSQAASGNTQTIYYSFISSSPIFYNLPDWITSVSSDISGTFAEFSPEQKKNAVAAMQAWASVANIVFVEYDGPGTEIRFGAYNDPSAGENAFHQGTYIMINNAKVEHDKPTEFGGGRTTLLHELGHALGLDLDARGPGPNTYVNKASHYEDSRQYTVMSYFLPTETGANFGGRLPSAPMLDDIRAVQLLHGANMSAATGDTTYGASTSPVLAVWDAGGFDTFDFSGNAFSQDIDLRQGHFSNTLGMTGNYAIAIGTVIEAAKLGSGGGSINGNDSDNTIYGGSGNDVLLAHGGDDVIAGSDGVDTIDGGTGTNILTYTLLNKGIHVNSGHISYDMSSSWDGTSGTSYVNVGQVRGTALTDVFDIDGSSTRDYRGLGGADTFKVGLLNGNVTFSIDGGEGQDLLDFGLLRDYASVPTILYNLSNNVISLNGMGSIQIQSIEIMDFGGLSSQINGTAQNDSILSGNGNSIVFGGDGNDIITSVSIIAGTTRNAIYGEGGNDQIILQSASIASGGDGSDTIHGSAGADVISGDGDSDRLYGGGGDDRISGGLQSDFIDGGADIDTAVYSFTSVKDGDGAELVGYTKSGSRVFVVTTHDGGRTLERDLLVNVERIEFLDRTIDFSDSATPTAFVNDSYKDTLGRGLILTPLASHVGGWDAAPGAYYDPLVLDMDGDGVELTSLVDSSTNFEFYVNGYAERTGWVKPDDAFLARDLNNNGVIDDSTELFGNNTTSGFDMLSTLDTNADGIIDVNDTGYAGLLVWNDLNGDGRSSANEIRSASAAGIASISTASSIVGLTVEGNSVPNRGSYTMTDSTVRTVDEVHFAVNHQVTRDNAASAFQPSIQSWELPALAAYGRMQTLQRAYDDNPEVVTGARAMQALAWSGDVSEIKATMKEFIRDWTGVPYHMNTIRSLRMDDMWVLNEYRGQSYPNTGSPTVEAAAGMMAEYNHLADSYIGKFLIQVANDPFYAMNATQPMSPILEALKGLEYAVGADVVTGDLVAAAAKLGAIVTQTNMDDVGSTVRALVQTLRYDDPMRVQMAHALTTAAGGDNTTKAILEGHVFADVTSRPTYNIIPGLADEPIKNLVLGTPTATVINTGDGNDYVLSGPGNQAIDMGAGNDVLIYRQGDGNDFMWSSSGQDRIVVGIGASDVISTQVSSAGHVFLIFAEGGYIGIGNVFNTSVIPDITIEFSDGTTWVMSDLEVQGIATSGDDTIIGSVAGDFLNGLAGNDVISGRGGNDFIAGGEGNDVLDGGSGNDYITSNESYEYSYDYMTGSFDSTKWLTGTGQDIIDGGAGDDNVTLADPYSIVSGGAGYDSLGIMSPYAVTIDLRGSNAMITNRIPGGSTIVQTVHGFEAYSVQSSNDPSLGGNIFEGSSAEDDISMSSMSDDTIRGHAGNDRITTYGGNDIIDGGAGIDTVMFYGMSDTFTLTTSAGGSIVVTNTDNPDSHTLTSIERIETWDGILAIQSPIVFDMDGNGASMRTMSTTGLFDMDGDGILDRTGWVGSGDALLVLDRNGDGSITSGSEISFIQDLPRAHTDMEGLSAHDENHDGRIDAQDSVYGALHLWMDDGDGISQASELLGLLDAGVTSIDLGTMGVAGTFGIGDNLVFGDGSYHRQDGTDGHILDAGFAFMASSEAGRNTMDDFVLPGNGPRMPYGYSRHESVQDLDESPSSVHWNEDLNTSMQWQQPTMVMPFDMIM